MSGTKRRLFWLAGLVMPAVTVTAGLLFFVGTVYAATPTETFSNGPSDAYLVVTGGKVAGTCQIQRTGVNNGRSSYTGICNRTDAQLTDGSGPCTMQVNATVVSFQQIDVSENLAGSPAFGKQCTDPSNAQIVGSTKMSTAAQSAGAVAQPTVPASSTCPTGYNAVGQGCTASPDPATKACPGAGKLDGTKTICTIDPLAKTPPAAAKEEPDNCPIAKDTDFRWAYCPVFNGLGLLTSTLDSFINQYLTVGNSMFSGAQEANYKTAWTTFRNFGIALVVAAGLVMLASEALGLQIVDAYTVRKVLPRLLVAIIGISVSWELCKFLVGFFDALGQAMGSIIYTSFGIGDAGISVASLLLTNFIAAGVIGAGALLLGGVGLLSMLGTLILAMLVGAFILILRQVIIVTAVLLAPLAIAAYVLPNTSKMAHFWWENLVKMLMLYPAATGIIALCKVLGQIALKNPGGPDANSAIGNLLATATGVILFILGYALLGILPRALGGVFATVAGMANDKSRGAFDRLKGVRGNQTAKNIAAMGEGRRFKGNTGIGKAFNSATRGAATFGSAESKLGFLGSKSQREAAYAARNINQQADFAKSPQGAAIMENDGALRALTYKNASEARANMKKDFGMDDAAISSSIASAQAAGGWSESRSQFAAKQLFNTGTGYDNAKQALETSARVAGQNSSRFADIAGYGNSITAQKGRHDLKAGFGAYTAAYGKEGGLRDQMRSGGAPKVSDAEQAAFYKEAVEGNDAVSFLRGKPTAMKNVAPVMRDELARQQTIASTSSGTVREEALHQAARYTGIIETYQQQGQMYASPQIKTVVNQQMVRPTSGDDIEVSFGQTMPAPPIGNRADIRDRITPTVGNQGLTNPKYSPAAADGRQEQAPARSRDDLDTRERMGL